MITGGFSRIVEHNYVQSVTYNNNKIYFSAEKSEWNIVRTTVEDENNGLWEVDIETGTKKKLSDECVFDDLLATENYLYCYRTDYLLSRGMANDWYKGYSLKQIPIN